MNKRINMQYGPDGGGCGSEGGPRLGKPLFLIGFMGVGKSSIAARLGQLLGVSAREMDDYIEAQVGLSIPEIFRQRGENFFREVESAAVAELGGQGPQVISCGGGVPLRQGNVDNMRACGVIVLLTAAPETIFSRVRHNQNRPLLAGYMNVEYIAQLMEQRRARYQAAADYQVSTDGKTVEEICREIVARLSGMAAE